MLAGGFDLARWQLGVIGRRPAARDVDQERIILVLARRADRFAPVPDLPSTEPNPNAEADQEQASDGDGDGDPRP